MNEENMPQQPIHGDDQPTDKLAAAHVRQKEQLELLQAQLHQQNDYLSRLSHQLRTPLMSIIGYAGLLNSENEQNQHYQAELLHAAETMLTILGDLPSAPDAIGTPQFRPCNMATLIGELKGFFSFEAQRKQLNYTLHWDSDIPSSLLCDLPRIRQVLIILVHNAIKFTPPGGKVTVHTSLQTSTSATVTLKWTVEDTGVGIPAKQLPTLFAPRAPSQGAQRRFGRAGKSIAQAAKLVESMGSTLQVHSEEGTGSRFHFLLTLPVYTRDDDTDTPVAATPAPKRWPEARVLVVDDLAMSCRLLQAMLHKLGIASVDMANNGEEATKLASSTPYDLILMDCQMPHMDGFAATRAIKQLPHSASIPIIGITADVMRADTAKCFAAGMDDYYHKPLAMHTLEQLLHKWLETGEAT